jgi:threonyl-tRNA synthetase
MNDRYEDFKDQLPDFVRNEKDFELYKLRHSAEHVFAHALSALFPGKVKLAVAHISENGFANDSHLDVVPNEEILAQVEEKMKEIITRNLPITREEVSIEEAREIFKDNAFKLEWLEQWASEGKAISIYRTGDEYVDLCKGPHVDSTGDIKAFKLLSIAGAYWRGDEKNEMLTRVYGTAFNSKEELDDYLTKQEEAKQRDHRKLIKDLDLVVFSDLVGAGLPIYTPRGNVLRKAIYDYSRELNSEIGYDEVHTPNFNRGELFKVSGHYDKYKDDMLRVSSQYSDEEMFIKPMNCPQHTQLFASRIRSYKDLPIRYADFANLARYERPGEMHLMLRTPVFAQDDGHAFVREDQIAAEFKNVLGVVLKALKTYDMKYWIRLSLRDLEKKEKYLGDDSIWEKAESKLKALLLDLGVEFVEAPGEAAIYGPKMDFMAQDSLGREWQISTIQIDMNMPGRFGLKYVDENGLEQTPIMIHRAIVGSERFIGIIIEHFGGSFPAWMSPEQVRIIPISEENNSYAYEIESKLKKVGVHVSVDPDNDRMQNKIRKAQEMKVPYMLILGKREAEAGQVSVRLRSGESMNGIPYEEFESKIISNIKERKLEIAL